LNFGLLLRKYKKIFILIFTLIIGLPAGTAWISRTEVTEADAGLRYYAFDVGEGDSSLFILPDGKTILVEAGPEDAGKKIVNELKKLGGKTISSTNLRHHETLRPLVSRLLLEI